MESNSFLIDANVYIGLYRGDDSQHQKALSIFEDLRDVIKEMTHFRSVPAALSFADITLIYLSKIWNAELITFDKQLLKLYKKSNSR
jgi:predicted nucleic acid-binding protein